MIPRKCLLAISFAVLAISCSPAQTIKGSTVQPESSRKGNLRAAQSSFNPPKNPNWQRYVLGSTTAIARPVSIVSTQGQIQNAAALLAPRNENPATLTRTGTDGSPTYIILDYGLDVGGLPTFDITAASGSPQLRASYSESLPYLTISGDHAPSHSADPHRFDSYAINGPGTITNAYVQGGERYQMISLTSPGTVALRAAGIKIGFYRAGADEYQGHFFCSDEELNKIWYACAYTLQTNMLPPGSIAAPKISRHNNVTTTGSNATGLSSIEAPTAYSAASARILDLLPTNKIPVVVDGARRDRSVWSGDLAVQGPAIYYSTGATEYMRESLRLLGSYGARDGRVSTNLPGEWPLGSGPTADSEARIYSANYTLWWVKALADYYLYTGDKEFLNEEWPILTRELGWAAAHVRRDGLFVTDQKNGNDWDYYDGPKVGAVTGYNALYYRVLIDCAGLADDLGQDIQAGQYRAAAAALNRAINSRLFNSSTGVFDTSDVERGGIDQDANVFAVTFGVAPQEKVGSILGKLKENLWTKNGPKPYSDPRYKPNISPYVTGFELLARLGINDTSNASDLMSRLWGTMIAPGEFQSGAIWETMTLEGKPGLGGSTSLAHGWGAMPAAALSSLVLGIQPVSAGYSTWKIQPHPGNLQWAEGRAPTPKGPIDVAWRSVPATAQFEMHVSTPPSASGEIAVPAFGKRVSISVNGRMVWNGKSGNAYGAHGDGNYIHLDHLPGGTYEILTKTDH